METIRLQFESNLKEKIMTFLGTLPSEGFEITVEDAFFEATKKRVHESFNRLKSGSEQLYDIDQAIEMLDKLSLDYESKV